MKKLLKRIATTAAAVALLLAPTVALAPSIAHASIADNICQGVVNTGDSTNTNATASDCAEGADGSQTFSELAKKIINVFSIVVGTVSVIMIIIGGFRYIISGGDSGGVTAGKNTILYAIVGLVIVLFAQVIVRFVLTNTATK